MCVCVCVCVYIYIYMIFGGIGRRALNNIKLSMSDLYIIDLSMKEVANAITMVDYLHHTFWCLAFLGTQLTRNAILKSFLMGSRKKYDYIGGMTPCVIFLSSMIYLSLFSNKWPSLKINNCLHMYVPFDQQSKDPFRARW